MARLVWPYLCPFVQSMCFKIALEQLSSGKACTDVRLQYAGALMYEYVDILRINIEGATVDDRKFISLNLKLLPMT
jgi:hypothetical protein